MPPSVATPCSISSRGTPEAATAACATPVWTAAVPLEVGARAAAALRVVVAQPKGEVRPRTQVRQKGEIRRMAPAVLRAVTTAVVVAGSVSDLVQNLGHLFSRS